MTEPLQHPARPAPPHRLGTVAVLTALMVACTTVRQPVALFQGPVPVRDGAAEPQLELWLESAAPVTPEEAAAATAEARAALEAALSGRRIGDGTQLLVVRAQGVSRTASHRSDQTAATVGLVLGAVVVIVAVVVIAASGGKGGKGGGSGGSVAASGARGLRPTGGHPPAVSPALPVAGVRPPPVRAGAAAGALASRPPPPPGVGPARPGPGPGRPGPVPYHPDHGGGGVAVGIYVNPGPIPLQGPPGPAELVSSRELSPAEAAALTGQAPAPPPAEPPAVVAEAAPLTQVTLPPLAPIPLDERGFFADDLLALELTLVDAETGAPRWQKWVEEEADVRDREAVRKILDRALGEAQGWVAVR